MNYQALINRGAIFYVSHSGGKDSQAMSAHLVNIIPAEQLVYVHSDLGEIEWDGTQDHIRNNIAGELNVVKANKTLFDMVRHRFATKPEVPSWPSSAHRQCTSDLKRSPIQKFIRQDMKKRGSELAVNCMGFRVEESPARAKRKAWSVNKDLTKNKRINREVYDWLPIHSWTLMQVWQAILSASQIPHYAYKFNPDTMLAEGNQRLSCVFCIMGCDNDLRHGAQQRPTLLQKYLEIESETGYTLFSGKSLADRIN